MLDLKDMSFQPSLQEISAWVECPVFDALCAAMDTVYHARHRIEYSRCSLEPGWNVKFRKSGKSLCVIYPRKHALTVMVVVGRKEKEAAKAMLPEVCERIRRVYEQCAEMNGQRWMLIDLEQEDEAYQDVLRLIDLRHTLR